MAGDPAILKRIRAGPFARSGRGPVRFRANRYSLFDEVVLLYPSHRGG
jgi:hypothetical protein